MASPAASTVDSDWRNSLLADSRERIRNKITETLMRHLPFSGQEGLLMLKTIAVRFEEKIYAHATSQSDYLRKISLKMLTMETRNPSTPVVNTLQTNATVTGEPSRINQDRPIGEAPRRGERPKRKRYARTTLPEVVDPPEKSFDINGSPPMVLTDGTKEFGVIKTEEELNVQSHSSLAEFLQCFNEIQNRASKYQEQSEADRKKLSELSQQLKEAETARDKACQECLFLKVEIDRVSRRYAIDLKAKENCIAALEEENSLLKKRIMSSTNEL